MSIASIRDRSAPALCRTLPYTWARTNVHPTCFVLPGPHSDLRAQLQLQLLSTSSSSFFFSSISSSSSESFAPRRVCRAGSVMGRAGRYHRQDTIKRGDERASRANTGILAAEQNERVSTVFDGWPSRHNCEVTKWRGRDPTCCRHPSLPPSILSSSSFSKSLTRSLTYEVRCTGWLTAPIGCRV